MAASYNLSGTFVECCDCFTICPCWVADKPDEDHCSGLYVWAFDAGSKVAGIDVGGASVAAATFHGNRAGGQAVLFVDETLGKPAQNALISAFSGRGGGALEDLSRLLGTIVDAGPARIETDFREGRFSVSVSIGTSKLAAANGEDKALDNKPLPMKLTDTALENELGIQGAVTVQEMERLAVSVATLPGGAYQFKGRSGMRGQFAYAHR